MIFSSYYSEIKNRVLLLAVSWLTVVLVSYVFKEVLLFVITKQDLSFTLIGDKFYFIFTDVSEVFTVYVTLVFFIANQILMFYIVYHILIFISPGLSRFEYSYLVFIFKTISFLFIVSIIVLNKILFPFSWSFFLSFKDFYILHSLSLCFEAKLSEYLTFYITFYYVCNLYFQTFLLIILFFKSVESDLLAYNHFRKSFHYFLIIFSTLVTPPDIFSQIIMGTCFIFCFEVLVYSFLLKNLLEKKNF